MGKLKQLSTERKRGKSDEWKYDLSVKDIKTSYLNSAIGELLRIATDYKAVIVIEKINEAYRQKMTCIDNQVYGVFEKKLESRLCDYKKKEIEEGAAGSLSNPLQLANSKLIGTSVQNGILFKLNAAYTETMCPFTGFTNLFDFGAIKTLSAKKEFLSSFDSIKLDPEDNNLVLFTFDYKNFNTKRNINKTKWTVCAGRARTEYNRAEQKYMYVEHPGQNLYELLVGQDKADKDLSKENLTAEITEELFSLLKNTLTNPIVKKCNEVEQEYYVSPIVKTKQMHPSKLKCYNMAKKFWFHCQREQQITPESAATYTEDWLNYAIE